MTHSIGHKRPSWIRLSLATLVMVAAGCGGEREQTEAGEHALSGHQRALERSKTAADAVESAAAEREARSEQLH